MKRSAIVNTILRNMHFVASTVTDFRSLREGGVFEKAAAGLNLITKLQNHFVTAEMPWQTAGRLNMCVVRGPKIDFFTTLALGLPHTREVPTENYGGSKWYYYQPPGHDDPIAVICIESWYKRLYVVPGYEEMIRKAVCDHVWEGCPSLRLFPAADFSFELAPAKVSKEVVGQDRLEAFVERLRKRKSSGGRSIVLRGPTGVGKSFLARYMARKVWGEDVKMLQITSDALPSLSPQGIEAVVHWFRPHVLILDDVPLEGNNVSTYLALYESLRQTGCTVITTLMTSATANPPTEAGSVYFPGMRPGRIDDVFTLSYPTLEERREILAHVYFKLAGRLLPSDVLEEIAAATEYLSFAYLESFIERVVVYGVSAWKEELAGLRMMAPIVKIDTPSPTPTASVSGDVPSPTTNTPSPAANTPNA